jgi:hypothetical protein
MVVRNEWSRNAGPTGMTVSWNTFSLIDQPMVWCKCCSARCHLEAIRRDISRDWRRGGMVVRNEWSRKVNASSSASSQPNRCSTASHTPDRLA